MEEEKWQIVEMKECNKKIDAALENKVVCSFLNVISSYCLCYNLRRIITEGEMDSIPFAILMLAGYVYSLIRAKKEHDIIVDNELLLENIESSKTK